MVLKEQECLPSAQAWSLAHALHGTVHQAQLTTLALARHPAVDPHRHVRLRRLCPHLKAALPPVPSVLLQLDLNRKGGFHYHYS